MFRYRTSSAQGRPAGALSVPGLLLAAVALALLPGCQKPLLAPDGQRTQYDRYDQVRNEHAPAYLLDEYGRERPNLRGRLLRR